VSGRGMGKQSGETVAVVVGASGYWSSVSGYAPSSSFDCKRSVSLSGHVYYVITGGQSAKQGGRDLGS
jgi:hypothetical protein